MGLKERQEVLNKPKLILYKLFKENFQTEEQRCQPNVRNLVENSVKSHFGVLRMLTVTEGTQWPRGEGGGNVPPPTAGES